MSDITIRRATMEDAQAIHRLNCEEMGYLYSIDNTTERLNALLHSEDHCIMVAALDASVVGYVHANSHELLYSDPLKNVMGIAVAVSCKRMGIGRELLAAIENWATEEGAVGVRLVSGSTRTAAHRFYTACGYTKNKEQLNFSKIFPLDG